jgi:hypothetical protein
MDKQALQAKVDELELTLNSLELTAQTTKDDLMEATKKLEDVSKPIITKQVVEQIREAVNQAIQQISFDNVESYEVEFEIDYNNSLALGSIEFNEVDQIEEFVCDHVEDLFNIIED